MATRWEPTPMARPSACAAAARLRLTLRARSKPPVIDEIKIGARSRLPRKVVLRSISSISNSGSALWTKR
jgi:hypothetical protein